MLACMKDIYALLLDQLDEISPEGFSLCVMTLLLPSFCIVIFEAPCFFAFRHAHVAEGPSDLNETSTIPAPILSPEDTEKLPSISLQGLQDSNGTLEVLNLKS
jgi:hypothetical protein